MDETQGRVNKGKNEAEWKASKKKETWRWMVKIKTDGMVNCKEWCKNTKMNEWKNMVKGDVKGMDNALGRVMKKNQVK